jgi:phage antirepressor YoqD-like protein
MKTITPGHTQATQTLVAESVGISQKTFYLWLERGIKAVKLRELGKRVPKNEKIFCKFCESVKQSEAKGEGVLITAIFSRITDDWHGLLWTKRKVDSG